MPLAETVNGHTGPEAISNMWKEQFESLLNSSTSAREYPILEELKNSKLL